MKDEHKHTNLPWRNRVMGSEGCRIFPDCEDKREAGKFIAMVNGRDFWTDQANAEFIVRACNAHDALVEALSNLLDCVDGNYREVADECRAALAFARGEVLQP